MGEAAWRGLSPCCVLPCSCVLLPVRDVCKKEGEEREKRTKKRKGKRKGEKEKIGQFSKPENFWGKNKR
jgi:hypothetical protein